jgi:hypothetical protein
MKTKKSAAVAALKTTEVKVTTSAAAPKPRAVKASPTTTSATVPSATKSDAGAVSTLDVKIDVGYGNTIFLRGQGSGLTWDHGVALSCVDGRTWRWSGKLNSPVTFKVLINDQVWAAGNDLVLTPGQKLEVAPQFN